MPAARACVDLNSQLAEGFALAPFGVPLADIRALQISATGERFHERHLRAHPENVLPYITSASLACGLHSGDPVLLRQVAREAIARGIQVGAHPSYPGVFSYGQRRLELSGEELEAVLLYQLGAVAAVVAGAGGRARHVKCHGPLAADISYDERICEVMVNAVRKFDPGLIVIFNAGSPGLAFARSAGLRVAGEGYVDRGYDASGRAVARNHPQALIKDVAAIRQRVVELAVEGQVTCVDGEKIKLEVETLFLHSDTAGAATFGAEVVAALKNAGVALKPLTDVVS